MNRLYFDWNASAPLREEAARTIRDIERYVGNPSSVHTEGRKLRELLESYRKRFADALEAGGGRVVFTSGATEGNHLAIFGLARSALKQSRVKQIILGSIEHPAVDAPVQMLESFGWKAVRVDPESSGVVDPVKFLSAARGASVASLMLANNEVGSIQPVREIATNCNIPLHTDATQALGKIPFSFEKLGADVATFSSHKVGGPRGVGAMIVKDISSLSPVLAGGSQEFGLRSGTENVPGIAGFVVATELAVQHLADATARWNTLNPLLRDLLIQQFPGARFTVSVAQALPNTVSVQLPGVDGRALVVALDLMGVACSVGSACASGSVVPSKVLLSLGLNSSDARSTVRLSMGPNQTREDVVELVRRLGSAVENLHAR
ncbi:MAG: cysteine desulfurase [Planctomycetes bacterium]|nr:cysteine desulfurase [Planctomycetota bacterium]